MVMTLMVIALSSARAIPLSQMLTHSVIEDIISTLKQASTTSIQDTTLLSGEDSFPLTIQHILMLKLLMV